MRSMKAISRAVKGMGRSLRVKRELLKKLKADYRVRGSEHTKKMIDKVMVEIKQMLKERVK